jgi:hypothetical protein
MTHASKGRCATITPQGNKAMKNEKLRIKNKKSDAPSFRKTALSC